MGVVQLLFLGDTTSGFWPMNRLRNTVLRFADPWNVSPFHWLP